MQKSKRKIFIHSGSPKAASTMLQRSYFKYYEGNIGKPFLKKPLSYYERLEILKSSLNKDGDLLFSDEAFAWGTVESEDYLKKAKEILKNERVIEIFIVREYYSFLFSLFKYLGFRFSCYNIKKFSENLKIKFPYILNYRDGITPFFDLNEDIILLNFENEKEYNFSTIIDYLRGKGLLIPKLKSNKITNSSRRNFYHLAFRNLNFTRFKNSIDAHISK